MGVRLTNREAEIAELLAWGASKKEVAKYLFVSERTVENHTRSIYKKTKCGKVNELSAWWFCTNFNISFELSPLKRKIVSALMLLVFLPQIYMSYDDMVRRSNRSRARTSNMRTFRARRRNEFDWY